MTQAEKRSMLLDDVPLRMKTARREAAPPAPTSSSGAASSQAEAVAGFKDGAADAGEGGET